MLSRTYVRIRITTVSQRTSALGMYIVSALRANNSLLRYAAELLQYRAQGDTNFGHKKKGGHPKVPARVLLGALDSVSDFVAHLLVHGSDLRVCLVQRQA